MTSHPQPYLLLVEDDPVDEKLALRALHRSCPGTQVVVARDGVEAQRLILGTHDSAGEPPALVLLDIKLPGADGLEVLRNVRADARTRCLPIVMLSASREERDLLESYRLGANAYVRKPLDFEEFTQSMRLIVGFWLTLNERVPRVTP